jgi:hypothetical protein
MASTYSTNLGIELIATGEQSGTWGATTNTNLGTLIEQAISGYVTQIISDSADTVITMPDGTTGVARNMFLELTSTGSLTATRNLIVPADKKLYFIYNNTTGGYAVTVKVTGLTGVSVPNGRKVILVCNGTDIVEAHNAISGNATVGGTLVVTGATTSASLSLGTALPVASGGTGVTSSTGSGSNVLSTSPTLVTPALGTPSALVGTNITGTAASLTAGNATTAAACSGNAATATTSAALTNGGTLNTPVSGTLTNCTGLPIVAGTTGTLSVARGGTGVTGSTGSGSVVLNTNPDLDEPFIKNQGASYPECASFMGVGSNNIGFGWASPDAYVSIDNALSGVFFTVSDYRIKKDVKNFTSDAASTIKNIRVVDYEMLELDGTQSPDKAGVRRVGVIAHEIQALIPDAASGTKDAVNADGSPHYQSVNYDAVVPYLIKTIQELTARIEKLEG